MRLKQLYTGELTRRELINLISHLPQESALGRAILGPRADWTQERELQAAMVDALHIANWQRGTDPDRPTKAPTPIRRPEAR